MGAQVALYRRWGFSAQPIAVALTLVGAANAIFFVALPPLGLVLLQLGGEGRTGLLAIALGALTLVAVIIGVIVRSNRHEPAARRAATLASNSVVFACVVMSLRVCGADPTQLS